VSEVTFAPPLAGLFLLGPRHKKTPSSLVLGGSREVVASVWASGRAAGARLAHTGGQRNSPPGGESSQARIGRGRVTENSAEDVLVYSTSMSQARFHFLQVPVCAAHIPIDWIK
jgi:hypothetical protein